MHSGSCHLGSKAEVYDAELHAAHEALTYLSTTNYTPAQAYLCIDNSSAIEALTDNTYESEYAREAIHSASHLTTNGWTINAIWTPSHCGITGNERADDLAQEGAQTSTTPGPHARTTQAWLYAESKRILLHEWKQHLPHAHASLRFPSHLKNLSRRESSALFRLQCARTPSDTYHGTEPTPCACGPDMESSQHILAECPLSDEPRTTLTKDARGDINTTAFMHDKHNLPAILRFLDTTKLGHSKDLQYHTRTPSPPISSYSNQPEMPEFE